ncbi:histidine phosphatase superfamily [Gamsiella multidivaricata]|uniref:histidine phosphatase superfamily n=1 Tax=Gamsiella multidivaricata TaxID=101098 RepID=UPI00221F73BE|nr:histidine phosphatase superfamily [Gamsiella multidivaricata]KAI7817799.1 histidine phosphatase superfamily [Gamsiella multidivaricata]
MLILIVLMANVTVDRKFRVKECTALYSTWRSVMIIRIPRVNTCSPFQGPSYICDLCLSIHLYSTPLTVYPQDRDLTWECSTSSGYFTFSGPIGSSDIQTRLNGTAVLTNHAVTIQQNSPDSGLMWKGGCIPGELTSLGAQQQQRMGQDLHKIYIDQWKLLPATFDPNTLRLRSTDVWRTKQSAENLMIGLYGQDALERGCAPSVCQIQILPEEIDYMTMNTNRCPRIDILDEDINRTSKVLEQLRWTHGAFRKDVNRLINKDRDLGFDGLIDAILPRICHGLPLQCEEAPINQSSPRCVTRKMAERCLSVASLENAETRRDAQDVREMLQLGIGPLAKDIRQNLLKAKNGESAPFLVFSGHDTTLIPLLGMLGSTDMRWPPYASNLLFEVWSPPSKEYFVRVLYNGRVVKTTSNWCDFEWCSLDTFIEYLGQFIVDDLDAKCKTTVPQRFFERQERTASLRHSR